MLGKLLIFAFTFLGVFALIMATLPAEFITASYVYNPDYEAKTWEDEFDANDLLVYDNLATDNMTFSYDSIYDGPAAPDWEFGLPTDVYLRVTWQYELLGLGDYIMLREVCRHDVLGIVWYTISDTLIWTFKNETVSDSGDSLDRDDLVSYWNPVTNACAFTVKGDNIPACSFLIFQANNSRTIGQNWDDGELSYAFSYTANFTASGINVFTVMGNLLGFGSWSVGVPNPWGSFLNSLIAIPMWGCIAYIAYKIITGLIPWVSGGSGD